MNIDNSFFFPEERDGFYIRSMMKRYWAVQLKVLEEIDIVCRHHDIKYFAHFGTLLGVIRHKGFIPWDDDTDIGMLRSDYMRFLKYAKEELPEGYSVNNYLRSALFPTRVVNAKSLIEYNPPFLEKFYGCPYQAGVDVFVIDNLPDNDSEKEEIIQIYSALKSWTKIIEEKTKEYGKNYQFDMKELELKGMIEQITGVHLDNRETLVGDIAFLADRISAMYYDVPTKEVANYIDYSYDKTGIFNVDCVKKCIYMPFECIELPVPVGYDEVLSRIYGADYMTPKKDAKSAHDYGLQKFEDILFPQFTNKGVEIPEFLKM